MIDARFTKSPMVRSPWPQGRRAEISAKEKDHTGHGVAFVISILLSLFLGSVCFGQVAQNKIDTSKIAVVLPFESTVSKAGGLPEATRTAVIQLLKDEKIFAGVLTPEEAKDKDKATLVEISAKLVEFAPGNMAARVLVGMGSGRSSAAYDFTIRDSATGNVFWQNHIKEKASVWSNSASSAVQRLELPEKIAKTLVKRLQGKKK